MKVIVETKTVLGSGAETRVFPAETDITKQLQECVKQVLTYEGITPERDETDDGDYESYNDGIATIEPDQASFGLNDTTYTWVVCELILPENHLTIVVQDGMVHTVYADQPGIIDFDVLDLDTDDDDQAAVNCSIMDSIRNRMYEVAGWHEEPNE